MPPTPHLSRGGKGSSRSKKVGPSKGMEKNNYINAPVHPFGPSTPVISHCILPLQMFPRPTATATHAQFRDVRALPHLSTSETLAVISPTDL
ncbi:T. brucei spp.-specific protein [Trypanosoma brucei gambiense DAL972]|uniref:T. brucei spp.-specific protein n=2 Tax=Trypanosoma brucei TaxID=5691 RepID=Q38FN4_TRYB2|nr:T. brucei spp.-specific protein [Trypanosoma brucei gambiense DAL972]XP_803596.1 hypothetical protein Tb09.160.1550 [Trypanosoma brucei brucei TREU927]EAN76386.1 hypothetical protein Tb09.160.1550 [Trypanosoma brucei brucei TREU927]CBH14065.1 T. brucei spp.-specific protein [Trypanosoma brucei gambiense DAL972]|eukprot:XP_011776336.1 T. brucei spp.-specific protein [Trypanosoma brucei gambiense DAL972]